MQQHILDFNTKDASNWMTLGSYKMMNGYYHEAQEDFLKARYLDSLSQVINFNLALNYFYMLDSAKAKELLLANLSDNKEAQAQGESKIFLGMILSQSKDSIILKQAEQYLHQAVNMYAQGLQANPSSPSLYMWSGIANLVLTNTETALNQLQIAEFLETRPFYSAMINLWLGKAYLALDDKQTARDCLGKVLSLPSADYHQKEAKELLEH